MKFKCPCCGYKTLDRERAWDICPVCFWEDDAIQYDKPEYSGGANRISLIEARENYKKIGCVEEEFKQFVREPLDCEKNEEIYVYIQENNCSNSDEKDIVRREKSRIKKWIVRRALAYFFVVAIFIFIFVCILNIQKIYIRVISSIIFSLDLVVLSGHIYKDMKNYLELKKKLEDVHKDAM